MSRNLCRRGHITVWATILTAAMCTASSRESRTTERSAIDTAAHQLVSELLDPEMSSHRPPLTSNDEHARTIDPVLTRDAAVWIHEDLPAPPLTVIGGRVFSYRDLLYDPLDAPLLKIRPIDDGQHIPFLARVVLQPKSPISHETAVNLSLPASPIFNPRVTDVNAWVGPDRVQASIRRSVESATIGIRVPLTKAGIEQPDGPETPITVIVEGVLLLDTYRTFSPGRFRNVDETSYGPAVDRLSELQVGLDVADDDGIRRIREIAGTVAAENTTDYEKVVAVNSWVADSLQYRESPATRTPHGSTKAATTYTTSTATTTASHSPTSPAKTWSHGNGTQPYSSAQTPATECSPAPASSQKTAHPQ